MLQKKIESLIKVSDVLNSFVSGHSDALDRKGVSELATLRTRLGAALSSINGDRNTITAGRSTKKESWTRLRSSVREARRALDLVSIREKKAHETPRFRGWLRNPLKVAELGAKYVEALEAAGSNPILEETLSSLKSALDEYARWRGDVAQKVYETRAYKRGFEREISFISGKLTSLCSYAAYNVSEADRGKLYALIKDVMPAVRTRTAKTKDDSASTPTVQTVAPSLTQAAA